MQGTFIGFNTAGITFENRFMALLLKIKQENGFCQQYYLQAPILLDLLLILQNRLLVTFKSLQDQGETYKEKLIAYNESLIANIPAVEMTEIQQPNPERRIMSITHKPDETWSTLILVLQNEQVCTLCIEDRQVEALLAGIEYTLKTVGDQAFIQYLSSNLEFLMCYAVDLTTQPNIDYQHYPQEEWKIFEEKLKQLPLTSTGARKFVRFFFAGAVECDLDNQGRIILPSNLREYAGLKKDIVSIGVNNRIEIWNKENWKEYNEEENFISNDLAFEMENLGI